MRQRRRGAGLTALAVVTALVGGGCASTADAVRPGAPASGRSAPASVAPAPRADPLESYVRARLDNMTLRQKVASLLMLHHPGTDAAGLRAFADRYGLGGLILMGDNIPATPAELASQTSAMQSSDPGLPLLVGIDEEGGEVTRLPWDTVPGADVLKNRPAAETRSTFARRAELLAQCGVNVNFGTVADVTADRRSFIFDRVLGTTSADAAARVAASVQGEGGAVVSTLKHFPGHGETEADSHTIIPSTPVSEDEWEQQDAPPFRAGIEAGARLIMFGHLVYSAVDARPASLSSAWHAILRDRLGYRGATITDDLRMLQDTGLPQYQDAAENAVQALAAGNTMVLDVLPAGAEGSAVDPDRIVDAVVGAVQSGRIPLAQIDSDASTLLRMRRALAPEK